MIKLIFILRDGSRKEVEAIKGNSLLETAHLNGINELEGSCEGCLSCSTCHIIVDNSWFERLSKASEDEEDMLDFAFGLTKTSRLGCQITIDETLDGLIVSLPQGSNNMLLE